MQRVLFWVGVVVGVSGCASELEAEDAWETDDALIAAGDLDGTEEDGSDGDGSSEGISAAQLAVRTNANFRAGPSTSNEILRVLPTGTRVTLLQDGQKGNAWRKVSFRGLEGFMASSLLEAAPSPESVAASEARREEVLQRSRGALGYSYWRGHSKWQPFSAAPNEPTAYVAGRSSGGTDCSGLVGKVWHVPDWNTDPLEDKRAYVTRHFRYSTSKEWVRISRSEAKPADAYVWNDGGTHGHIVVVRGTDAWGGVQTYEAKGKKYGIVEDLRKNLSSQYVAIRRRGI